LRTLVTAVVRNRLGEPLATSLPRVIIEQAERRRAHLPFLTCQCVSSGA